MSVKIPLSVSSPNVATSLTAPGVSGKSYYVKFANWRVSGSAVVGASNLAVTLKDGNTVIYRSAIPAGSINGANLSLVFPEDGLFITEGNSITYDIATPNNAGCIIYANMGLELK